MSRLPERVSPAKPEATTRYRDQDSWETWTDVDRWTIVDPADDEPRWTLVDPSYGKERTTGKNSRAGRDRSTPVAASES